MEFSEKVKIVRKAVHFSQEDLARQLGVSFATVNRWESGKTRPSRLAVMAFENFCKAHSIVMGCAEVPANTDYI